MTEHRYRELVAKLNLLMKVATIVALLGAPIGAYVAVASRLGAIMVMLNEHSKAMDEYKKEATVFRQQLTDLRLNDTNFATAERLGIVEARVENHEIRLRVIEKNHP